MTERAQALEAAIEKARQCLVGFAAEIHDGRVPVVGAVRDHLVLNIGLIASFLSDALLAVPPPPPVGSPTKIGESLGLSENLIVLSTPVEPAGMTGQVRLCGALHMDTSAVCELPLDHTENHRGSFSRGIAQWPYESVEPAGASEPPSAWIPTERCICDLCRAARLSPAPVSPVEPTPEPPKCVCSACEPLVDPGQRPSLEDINRLEKAAWDSKTDRVLVWYRDQIGLYQQRIRETERAWQLERKQKPTGAPAPCVWRLETDLDYTSGCGRSHAIHTGGSFCGYCGHPLTVER